jgi:flagellar hook-associated protein 1
MSGLFGLLQTAKLSIFASEMSLGILNHNVANANTPGYHRQRVNMSPRGNIVGLGGAIGGGVNIDGIQRFANSFIENQLGRAASDKGEQSTLARNFSIMETIFGEPADDIMGERGLGDVISDFLNAWQPVVNPELDSEDADTRSLILETARGMAHRFNDLAGNIQDHAQALRDEVHGKVSDVNALLDQVGQLNLELNSATLNDSARADLEDMRTQKLEQLSGLAGATWSMSEQGQMKVYISGRAVVDHVTVHGLEAERIVRDRVDGMRVLPADDDHPMSMPGGELRSLMQMLDTEIPEIMSRLDNLAGRFIDSVNEIHQAASGDGGGGVDFFVGSDASTIAVSGVLADDPDMISLSGTLPDGRDIASAIFDLHTESVDPERGLTLEGLYAGLIGHLGARSASSTQLANAADRLHSGLQQKLESEVGVSIDEELSQMMVVQTSYQAAAKVIAAIDEMLQVLVSI